MRVEVGVSQHRAMRTWGTEVSVADEAGSRAHFEALARRLPAVASAYHPSGTMPFTGLVALLGGGVLGALLGSLTGVVVAAISLGLFSLMALLIAVIAACGFVACITIVWGLGVAVVGGGLTFGGLGWVAAWTTARTGKLGKNRNVTAAVVIAFGATFVAWCVVASLPPILASFVPTSTDDFSLNGLVHIFGDYGWLHVVVLIVGLLFALVMAFVGAEDEVKSQKFCEPCGAFMGTKSLPAMSLVVAEQVARSLAVRDMVAIVDVLASDTGSDVEPTLHRCPKCGAGYLEGRLWAHAKYVDDKGDKIVDRDWLAISAHLRPEHALPLSRLPDRKD